MSRDATALQRKIFSRWCRQKLLKIHHDVTDIVEDCKDGVTLLKLMEVLSEKSYPGKPIKATKMRVKQIDNLNNVLKFIFDQGIEMKIKPQAEDFTDGRERAVLGLIWAVMLKYMKIGDPEEGTLNAKDALLMWANNKTAKYDCGELKSFKDFKKDGKALCAIVHKHRPKLIDYDGLGGDVIANTRAAMDAAEKYFLLEQYLTPEEFTKLDENSMVVYVSEYYYGIAEQRRIDNAVRRITKVIQYTEKNDALKAEFAEKANAFKSTTANAETLLGDRTIDNTMAGAKRRIEEFYEYKKNDKNVIIGLQLNLESLFNSIAMRLAQGKRPEFVPGPGLTLKDIAACVAQLEEAEQERKVALHAELNRQIKLVRWDDRHKARHALISEWFAQKKAYLETREDISSVSEAQLQLATLDAYDAERNSVWEGSVALLKSLGADLASEKYERSDEVANRESEVDSHFSELDALSAAKRPVLDDALAREEYKVEIRLLNKEHIDGFEKLQDWVSQKEAYLNAKEDINSIADAQTQISLLKAYEKSKVAMHGANVVALQALGQQIRDAKYETEHSSWVFETPEETVDRESQIDAKWEELSALSEAKSGVLAEDLAREKEKERLRLLFAGQAAAFRRWATDAATEDASAEFGSTLEEVEAYQATLEANQASVNGDADAKVAEYTGTFNAAADMGVVENVYTSDTPDSLSGAREELSAALRDTSDRYAAELQRQRENDALCQEFAKAADGFAEWISQQKEQITNAKDELEAQLSAVEARIASKAEDGAPLSTVNELSGQMEAKGITTNRHTNQTATDLEVLFEQYGIFLDRKKEMLETAIEHEKLRGVDQETMDEIEENFTQFDTDGNNLIERRELRACLYSLGEEKTSGETDAIVEEYGTDGAVNMEGFKEFMITIFGVSANKEDIFEGFDLIKRGDANITREKLDIAGMDEHEIGYIESTAPDAEDGAKDDRAWTEDVFSR